jgi:hypothetical protein
VKITFRFDDGIGRLFPESLPSFKCTRGSAEDVEKYGAFARIEWDYSRHEMVLILNGYEQASIDELKQILEFMELPETLKTLRDAMAVWGAKQEGG